MKTVLTSEMNCKFTELVSYFVDGELSPIEEQNVRRHLAECRECKQAHADFLQLRGQISAYAPGIPEVDTREVLHRILSGPRPERSRRREPSPFVGRLSWGSGSAAAVAAILIVGFVALALLFYRTSNRQIAGEKTKVITSPPATTPTGPPAPSLTRNDASPQRITSEAVVKSEPRERQNLRRGVLDKGTKPGGARPLTPREPMVPNESVATNKGNEGNEGEVVIRPADAATLTAQHLEQSELLLRSFRNVRLAEAGEVAEIGYEKRRAQQLVYQNILLRREADASGDIEVATLLDSLEPILLDIANLPDRPMDGDVQTIKDRLKRKNLVALLQVNSSALARANE